MSAARLELLDHALRQCVESGQLPFARLKVMRHGLLVHDVTVNSGLGTQTEDSIYRYYSMTKIVTSVATLLAVERGLMRLDDPVEKYIPEAANAHVVVQGTAAAGTLQTEPAESMFTVRQCLTHTAGLGYGGLSTAGFGMMNDEVDEAYLAAGCGADMLAGGMTKFSSLAELAAVLAAQPLRHHPGQKFDYAMGHVSLMTASSSCESLAGSFATGAQILAGRCTEVAMGGDRTLTEIIQQEIFDTLGMEEAGWGVHETDSRVLPIYRCEYTCATRSHIELKCW